MREDSLCRGSLLCRNLEYVEHNNLDIYSSEIENGENALLIFVN